MAGRVLSRYSRDNSEFDRAVAFIDATFAVALTLLVTTLDISSNPSAWDNLGDFYDSMGSQVLSFAISFVVIAGYWLAHYRLFASFAAIDHQLIVVNLFMLASIVLLPFTTETAGNPDINDLPLPTVVLAVNVAAVSTAFTLIYVMAHRRGLLRTDPTQHEFQWGAAICFIPAIVFLASIPIAYWVDPGYAQLSWLSLVPINVILSRVSSRDDRSRGIHQGPAGDPG